MRKYLWSCSTSRQRVTASEIRVWISYTFYSWLTLAELLIAPDRVMPWQQNAEFYCFEIHLFMRKSTIVWTCCTVQSHGHVQVENCQLICIEIGAVVSLCRIFFLPWHLKTRREMRRSESIRRVCCDNFVLLLLPSFWRRPWERHLRRIASSGGVKEQAVTSCQPVAGQVN